MYLEFQYNKEESLKQLKNLLQQLPEENFLVLRYLCSFLIKVIHHEDTNKMNSMALAIVFGPNLFRYVLAVVIDITVYDTGPLFIRMEVKCLS